MLAEGLPPDFHRLLPAKVPRLLIGEDLRLVGLRI
jgi:hypothetical protein